MAAGAASPAAASGSVSHIPALDALRGVCSILVVFWHFYVTLPTALQFRYEWLLLTPLRFVPAIVVVFFMLSGFVLALPYTGARPPSYAQFLIKRLGRLYIPFAVLMALAWVLLVLAGVSRVDANDMSFHIANLGPPRDFTLASLGHALLLTGLRKDDLANPAIWTLAHEMRISLAFPALVFLCRRLDVSIAAMVVFYIAAAILQDTVGHYEGFPALMDDAGTGWITTLYLTPCFMLGILLARHRERLVRYLSRRWTGTRVLLWLLAVANLWLMTDFEVRQPFTECGAALLIALLLSSPAAAKMAENRILQGLGRMSYSTYLVHLPILFVLRKEMEGAVGRVWIFLICIALTLPAAVLAQRFIEMPARNIAKRIARAAS